MRSAEELLYKDKNGVLGQLQDVMDDGLDGGYEDRLPELNQLLADGSPQDRLGSCMLLVAWGRPAGFDALIGWASDPEHTPWAGATVTYDRIHGTDDSFSNLADALRTSFWNERNDELRRMQRDAASALLGVCSRFFVDRNLALAINRDKSIAAELQLKIVETISLCLNSLDRGEKPGFDLSFQIATLILPLAVTNDTEAFRCADELIRRAGENIRAIRELVTALAEGRGQATLKTLERLSYDRNRTIAADAEKAIRARQDRKNEPR